MNPTLLELNGFTSHRATSVHLNGEHLVAAVGPNGAGKSSLLSDAIEFALFGIARGDRAEDLVQLGSSDMSVVFQFLFAGAEYRVSRGRTTRSGGKPFLELGVRDGETWRPLSGATVRETQAAIEHLLHLDHETFRQAVLLGQGDAHRFANATAGDRKKVLAQVLGLEVYGLAEVEARQRARDVEASIAAERQQLQRLEERIADEPQVQITVAGCRTDLEQLQNTAALALSSRAEAEAALRQLAGDVAKADAATKELERLTEQRTALAERWRAAKARRLESEGRMDAARSALERKAEIEAAAASVTALRSAVEGFEQQLQQERAADRELQAAKDELRQAERSHEAAVAAHASRLAQAKARVGELEGLVGNDDLSTCTKCGKRNACGHSADLAGRLEVARQELIAVGDPPVPPLSLDMARAKVSRAETRVRETTIDEPAMAAARGDLRSAELLAAQAREIELAAATVDRSLAEIDQVDTELRSIDLEGQSVKTAIGEAQERVDAAASLREQQQTQQQVLDAAGEALAVIERERTTAAAQLARAEASLEQIEQAKAERTAIEARVGAAVQLLDRLKKLVVAFGPKGIPARIVESVLPELAAHANDLLEQLRPGMVLELRAQRAKKDGDGVIEALDLVVRDSAGERPLSVFSGGERMSVSLAIAVALSRLVARRSGSPISLLVIDEPEGLDLESRQAFGQALRAIAHRGELDRVLVVSHYDDIADFADLVLRVEKVDGASHVEAVAA